MNVRRMHSEGLGILMALRTLSSAASGVTASEVAHHTGYELNQVLAHFAWLQSKCFVCSGSSPNAQKFHLTPLGIRELGPL